MEAQASSVSCVDCQERPVACGSHGARWGDLSKKMLGNTDSIMTMTSSYHWVGHPWFCHLPTYTVFILFFHSSRLHTQFLHNLSPTVDWIWCSKYSTRLDHENSIWIHVVFLLVTSNKSLLSPWWGMSWIKIFRPATSPRKTLQNKSCKQVVATGIGHVAQRSPAMTQLLL